ncbi:MAG: DUF2269 domain-containing protein [Alphaproteobacteria bacterium]|nr:DUF2269 domain-containing protein [Alphaproteobacteria bacterium]
MASPGLDGVGGLFRVPVVFMEIEMRDLGRLAVRNAAPLPERPFVLCRR